MTAHGQHCEQSHRARRGRRVRHCPGLRLERRWSGVWPHSSTRGRPAALHARLAPLPTPAPPSARPAGGAPPRLRTSASSSVIWLGITQCWVFSGWRLSTNIHAFPPPSFQGLTTHFSSLSDLPSSGWTQLLPHSLTPKGPRGCSRVRR